VDSGELQEGGFRRSATVPKWMLAAVALLAVAVALYLLRRSPEKASHPTTTFTQLTSLAGVESFPSLSPDGSSSHVVRLLKRGHLPAEGGQNAINLTEDSLPMTPSLPFSRRNPHRFPA
jgi:hypothetical protein